MALKDVVLPPGFLTKESVNAMVWHPTEDLLLVCGGEGAVALIEYEKGVPSEKRCFQIDDILLSCCWLPTLKDFSTFALGGYSGNLYVLKSDGSYIAGVEKAHARPISCLNIDINHRTIISAGWDWQLKRWSVDALLNTPPSDKPNVSQLFHPLFYNASAAASSSSDSSSIAKPNLEKETDVIDVDEVLCLKCEPVWQYQLVEDPLCMDVRGDTCVVATGPQPTTGHYSLVTVLTLAPQEMLLVRNISSPLKYQVRSIAIFVDERGVFIGSVEGRVAIMHIESGSTGDFVFKCHRDPERKLIFSVNAICVHSSGTFATVGGDGHYHYWCKVQRTRLKSFPISSIPISAAALHSNGKHFALARGDDHSTPYTSKSATQPPATVICITDVGSAEFKSKAAKSFK